MSDKRFPSRKNPVGKLGVSLAGGVVLGAQALVLPLFASGASAAEGKCGEGKCGTRRAAASAEGKCGAQAKARAAEGGCGARADAAPAEGKCGEGKCGDASFARADSNRDGRVSRAEFLALAAGGDADFTRMDSDRDGFISENEAHDFLKRTYQAHGKPMPKGLFSHIDD